MNRKDIIRYVSMLVLAAVILVQTACSQGFEVKLGIGRYSEAHEVRNYKEVPEK